MALQRNPSPRYPTKEALLAAGAAVEANDYARASRDKSGRVKSCKSQHKDNGARIERHQWHWAASFEDNDESGADESRVGFNKLRQNMAANRPDVLVLWMINREARDLEIYASLRNHCLRHGVCYWLVGTALYDLRDKDDRLQLGIQAVLAENFRDGLIAAVTRGMRDAAHDGDPAPGICPFGFRRIYDPRTGALVGQEPDNAVPEWLTGADRWTPWEIVEGIFGRAGDGEPLKSILRWLNERGVPNPRTFNALQKGYAPVYRRGKNAGQAWSPEWKPFPLRSLLLNPAYIGQRRYHGEVVRRGCWVGLNDADAFRDIGRDLRLPSRRTHRGTQPAHHLSGIALCDVCDEELQPRTRQPIYRCQRGHVGIVRAKLDQFIISAVVLWLSDPERCASFRAVEGDDPALKAAVARLTALRGEEEEWDELAERGRVKPKVYDARMTELVREIEQADLAVRELRGFPGNVREAMGPEAAKHWARLELRAQRDLLRALLEVRVKPVGKGQRIAVEERVSVRWVLEGEPPNG